MQDGGSTAGWDRYAQRSQYFAASLDEVPGLDAAVRAGSGTFVELGCGDGTRLARLILDGALAPYARVLAFDISSERVTRCRELGLPVTFAVGDACAVDMPDGTVDFAFSDQVIEHVPDDGAMAREIARILRPGGRAVVGSVTKTPWAWYFHRCNGRWALDPTHVREYPDEATYAALFSRAGLQVDAITSRGVAFPLADLALRLAIRGGVLGGAAAARAYAQVPGLAHWRLPIPGYRLIWAFVSKR